MSAPETKKQVLVVDDEHSINEALQRRFRKLGCEAEGCFDGEQGLKRMKEKKFDCIMLDLVMPTKDGFAVLTERTATQNADTPVYVLTTLAEEKYQLALSLGAKKVFVKSEMEISEVIEAINADLHLGTAIAEA